MEKETLENSIVADNMGDFRNYERIRGTDIRMNSGNLTSSVYKKFII